MNSYLLTVVLFCVPKGFYLLLSWLEFLCCYFGCLEDCLSPCCEMYLYWDWGGQSFYFDCFAFSGSNTLFLSFEICLDEG